MVQTFENRAMLLKLSLFCQMHTVIDLFMSDMAQFKTV